MSNKDHEVIDEETGEVIDVGSVTAATLAEFPELRSVDPDAVRERIQARYKRAETIDDLFDVMGGGTSNRWIGRRIEVRSVAWQPYEADRGVIPLAVCQVLDLDTNKDDEFVTTADGLVGFLRAAQLMDAIPFRAKVVEKATKNRRTALNFERV